MRSGLAVLVSLVWLAPLTAFAQDDLLAPLAPEPSKPKAKAKPKSKPKASQTRKSQGKAPDEELVAPLIQKKTQLAITVTPADSVLSIDGKEVGVVPDHPLEIAPGEHTVTLKRAGYADVSVKVNAQEGQVAHVKEILEPSSGMLAVTADVPGAEVTVDGHPLGVSPVRDIALSPGVHEVVVKHEGYDDDTSRLNVRAGKQYTVSSHLKAAEARTHVVAAQSDRPEAVSLTPTETTETRVPAGSDESPWLIRHWYVPVGAAVIIAAVVGGVVYATKSGPVTYQSNNGGMFAGCVNTPQGDPYCPSLLR